MKPLVLAAGLLAAILIAGAASAATPPKLVAQPERFAPPPQPSAYLESPVGLVEVTPLYAGAAPRSLASALVAANNAEIQQAKLALSHSSNQAVIAFAQHMIKAHENANREILAVTMGRVPPATAVSRQIEAQGSNQSALLSQLHGASFDAVYMNFQIQAHTQALRLVEGSAGSMAMFPAFARLISQARSMIAEHLQMALAVRG